MPLSTEDKAVLELLEEVSRQYEDYLAITEVASLNIQEAGTEEPIYNWERPLTLVISKDD